MSDVITHYGTVNINPILEWKPGAIHITTESGRQETRQGHLSCTGLFGVFKYEALDYDSMKRKPAFAVVHIPTGIRAGSYWAEWKARGWANIQETCYDFWKKEGIHSDYHAYMARLANIALNVMEAKQGHGGMQVASMLEDYYTKRSIARKEIRPADLITGYTKINDEREVAQWCIDAVMHAPGGASGGLVAVQNEKPEKLN